MIACNGLRHRNNMQTSAISYGLQQLKNQLPKHCWTEDPDKIAPHLCEWRGSHHGRTPLMLSPQTTHEVSSAVKICAAHNLKITPQGGNTGLVGGQIPQGEVLLTLKHMQALRQLDLSANRMHVEAGMTLAQARTHAQDNARYFPLHMASQDTCTIGGNLSTNAGGNHVLKYGSMKTLVNGIEVVLPNGQVYNGLNSLHKDNSGYDLNQLFLGAEGTLGIITAATLKLFNPPAFIQRTMVACKHPEQIIELLPACRQANHLAMFEAMEAKGLDLVIHHIPNQRLPFSRGYPWYVLMDWECTDPEQGLELAQRVLMPALKSGLISDTLIAQSQQQANELLNLREHMSASLKSAGDMLKYDISVPISAIPAFLQTAQTLARDIVPDCQPVAFGHFGDGNIHYTLIQPENMLAGDFFNWATPLNNAIYDLVVTLNGSISAEHGIGITKKADLATYVDPVKLALLKTIKHALDPENIMNPRIML